MAKLRSSQIAKKLQKSLNNILLAHKQKLAKDVKEGHFAVIAVEEGEGKRFIVPLSYLNRPSFMRLLEGAAEEYGFVHEGALTVPCKPSELQRMLEERDHHHTTVGMNLSSCETMVKTQRC